MRPWHLASAHVPSHYLLYLWIELLEFDTCLLEHLKRRLLEYLNLKIEKRKEKKNTEKYFIFLTTFHSFFLASFFVKIILLFLSFLFTSFFKIVAIAFDTWYIQWLPLVILDFISCEFHWSIGYTFVLLSEPIKCTLMFLCDIYFSPFDVIKLIVPTLCRNVKNYFIVGL